MRVIAALVCVFSLACSAGASEVNWQPLDYEAAKAKAAREGKLIYIYVEGDNCPPCDSFKLTHLNDPVFADFVNTLYVPIRCHVGRPDAAAFLQSLHLNHAAIPRFYTLTPDGRGVSFSIGMVAAPPIGAVEVLAMAAGVPLPVNQGNALALAGRIRAYAARERSAGRLYPDGSNRHIGLAALEAWAWALGGRIDEAERAWGPEWANQLGDQELRYSYVTFWAKWNRNPTGTLVAAQEYRNLAPGDAAGQYLMGMALANNRRFQEAFQIGDQLMQSDPGNTAIQREIARWRSLAGYSYGQ
ncbi:MAG: thioredoxin family protein [Planctomycetes bacterium]|nr:thioredoxin family protein [Planctomycetota bacterium]